MVRLSSESLSLGLWESQAMVSGLLAACGNPLPSGPVAALASSPCAG